MKNSEHINQYLKLQGDVIYDLVNQSEQIRLVGEKFVEWWQEGRIFLGCGNGGSAAEISHMAGEATIRLRGDDTRPPFLFVNLAADSSTITAGGNDFGYDEVFARQVQACGWHIQKSGAKFVLIGASTSGASKNVIRAFQEARKLGIPTVGLTCDDPKKPVAELADYSLVVQTKPEINSTQATQTANLTLWHIWFEMIASNWKEEKEDKSVSSLSSPLATRLQQLVSQFVGKKVLECGDVMLDFTIRGKAAGLAPDAAAIKVMTRSNKFSFTSGGAANCAKNFRSLGADTTVWGVIDADNHNHPDRELPFGFILKKALDREEIKWIGESDPNRETTVKLRVEAAHAHTVAQQLVRIDLEVHDPFPPKEPSRLKGNFDAYHANDYCKGAVTPELIEILRTEAKSRNVPLIVDPKMGEGRDYYAFYHDVTAINPNDLELMELTGNHFDEADEQAVSRVGTEYARQLNTDVVVTRGQYGCSVCPIQGEAVHIMTLPVENPSVSGVGDTFTAAFTLALTCGANLVEAAHIAVLASFIAVSKPGTASKVSQQELLDEISRRVSQKLYPFV